MESGRWRAPVAHGPVRATLQLPGSKSISNRALMLAALSDSPAVLRGVLKARDTSLAIAALRVLGCSLEEYGTDLAVSGGSLDSGSSVSVDVGNAGTVMRFLPAVAALSAASVAVGRGVGAGRLYVGTFTVEPDLSNAGPFLAPALGTGGSVTIKDWPSDSLQPAGG